MPVFRRLAILVLAASVLAGCGVFSKKRPPPCPQVSPLKGALRQVTFAPGGGTDLSALQSDVRLVGLSASCKYSEDEVAVDLAVTIAARRGPADRSRKAGAKYFVAIMDPERKIIAKRVFDVTLEFPVNVDAGRLTDSLIQRIPLAKGEPGAAYRVVAGLQLTREQLDYNRRVARSRTPGNLGDIPIAPPARTSPTPEEGEFPPVDRKGGMGRVPAEPN
ncbi:MAG: hypothetical protein R3229_10800 [Alphaproteobacteria bacterium]|nr:hypothetical protein [Alphaproteobacteria bacterium]